MSQTDKELSPILRAAYAERTSQAAFSDNVARTRDESRRETAAFAVGERVRFSLHRDVVTRGEVVRELPACGACRVYVVRDHAGTTHKLAADKLGRVAR